MQYKKIIFAAIAVLLIGVLLWLGFRLFGPHPQDGMGMGAAPVTVAAAVEREIIEWDEFSGRLSAVESVEIRPRVSGVIEQVHFADGQWIRKGDPLFTIDPRPYAASLERAEAVLAAAKARSALAQTELERAKNLVKNKTISQSAYDTRRLNAEVAQAEAQAAMAAFNQTKLDFDYTAVKAPVEGRISRAEITVGNLVSTTPNTPVLTTIVSMNPIYADFDIDEFTFLKYLEMAGGDPSKLKNVPVHIGLIGEANTPHRGRVQAFDNQINTRAGTVRVRAVLDNPEGKLVPGFFARVRVGGAGAKKTVLVSERATGTDQNKKFVYVVNGESKAEYREVKLGSRAGGLRIVREGLKPGEVIVVNGLQRVRPGAPVQPTTIAMDEVEKKE